MTLSLERLKEIAAACDSCEKPNLHGTVGGYVLLEAAEARLFLKNYRAAPDVERLVEALASARKHVRIAQGAIESGQVHDKDVHGMLTRILQRIDTALAASIEGKTG